MLSYAVSTTPASAPAFFDCEKRASEHARSCIAGGSTSADVYAIDAAFGTPAAKLLFEMDAGHLIETRSPLVAAFGANSGRAQISQICPRSRII
jgi:hypothetical protein